MPLPVSQRLTARTSSSGKIFTSNEPSIALVKGLGWTEVGVHRRHGTLDGEWKDVLVVEKLLEAGGQTGP